MTSDIQWEEDWFSISCEPIRQGDGGGGGGGGDKEERREKEEESQVNQRTDWLERLIHHQSEIIRALSEEIGILTQEQTRLKQEMIKREEETQTLKEEMRMLKEEIHSTSHTSMTELLEELKRVKERELNYALRRHQPVPFFDSGNLMRMVGTINSVPSPLFRNQLSRSSTPSLHL